MNRTMKKNEISVIIPCYNSADTICDTLNSLKSQTYKDFEIIAIDDGSTDNTLSVLKNYKNNNPLRINIISTKNSGVSSARNLGIGLATSKYIAFVDSDDICHPDFFKYLVSELDKNNLDISLCKYQCINHLNYNFETVSNIKKEVKSKSELLNLYTHHRAEKLCFCACLFKKGIIDQYNIKFEKDLRYGEDTLFLLKYLKHCHAGIYIEYPLYEYYQRKNSATHSINYYNVDNIVSSKKIVDYWKDDPDYRQEWANYFLSRAIWAAAKTFASSNHENFERLQSDYDVKHAMKEMEKMGDERSIRLSSKIYLISPSLFENVIKLYTKISKKG